MIIALCQNFEIAGCTSEQQSSMPPTSSVKHAVHKVPTAGYHESDASFC